MESPKKVWLNEVSFMRPILLVLLVAYHAFAPYCGTWVKPATITDFEPYFWVASLSRAFRLEAFVFISGYIFTFQLITKNKFSTFWELTKSKLQRLVWPCFVFGILYILIILRLDMSWDTIYTLISGPGHLWYLICLFWLFLVQYAVMAFLRRQDENKVGRYYKIFFAVTLLLPILSAFPLSMRWDKAMYYMTFFYGGGLFYIFRDEIARLVTVRRTLWMWVAFAILVWIVFSLMIPKPEILKLPTVMEQAKLFMYNAYLKLVVAWVGIAAFYASAVLYCRKHKVGDTMIKIGTCGYGVYVFHQFFLKYAYNLTDYPIWTGTYWMPWIAFVVTVILSTVLTLLCRSTPLGKKYL